MCVSQRWVPLLRNHCFRIECYSRVQIKVMFEILLFFKYILCVVVVCNSDLFISVHRQPNQREKRKPIRWSQSVAEMFCFSQKHSSKHHKLPQRDKGFY